MEYSSFNRASESDSEFSSIEAQSDSQDLMDPAVEFSTNGSKKSSTKKAGTRGKRGSKGSK